MMNWDYIAGLFDGDGCGNLHFYTRHNAWGVSPHIRLAISKNSEPLKQFLYNQGISCGEATSRNILGKTEYLTIQSWRGVEIFVTKLLDKVYIKKEQINLLYQAVCLRREIKIDKTRKMKDNLCLFDEIRHKIHSYARKGPKSLKEYDFNRKI